MLAGDLDCRCRVLDEVSDRASLYGQTVEFPLTHTKNHWDPDHALVRRVTTQIEEPQEFFHLADVGRRVLERISS